MLRKALPALAVLAACTRTQEAGLAVEVRTERGVAADCVSIHASNTDGGVTLSSNRALRKDVLAFGVVRAKGLDSEVRLTARGWLGDCMGTPTLNALSPEVSATFPTSGVAGQAVVLELRSALDDGDLDGYRSRDAGGTDCDDALAAVNPGATESCQNGLDDDCNGKSDCADSPRCDQTTCDDGRACTSSDRCSGGRCEGLSPLCPNPTAACLKPPGQCLDDGGCQYAVDLGAPCDSGVCSSNGTCVPIGSELDCQNGLDDNQRDGIDCQDPSCAKQRCDDHLLCTVDDVCQDNGTCAGSTKSCPGTFACRDAGVCDPGSGACLYPIAVGSTCDDQDRCTTLDRCNADGGCTGQPKSCATPPNTACWVRQGTCEPSTGACRYQIDAGAPCDDSDPCTAGDVCGDGGFCLGSDITCPPAPLCFAAGICRADGGCGYAPATGGTCGDAGYCLAGACVPIEPFNYAPSNFLLNQVAAWAPPVHVTTTCDPTYDSTGGGSWVRSCAQTLPSPVTITLADGYPAHLLAFSGIAVDPLATWSFVGEKPVILVVRGDVTVAGTIEASSRRDLLTNRRGPGSNYAVCGLGAGGLGPFGSGRGGGGGGGAYGSPGSTGAHVTPQAQGGTAGTVNGNVTLIPLRGGCLGGVGGSSGLAQGNAGYGGGAIQLSVAGTLSLTGIIAASGSGGLGGSNDDFGGGGGGSGGALLLEARNLQLLPGSRLLTNGGGGGEGAGDNSTLSNVGAPGMNGSNLLATPALGGGLNLLGGDGANGGAGDTRSSLFVDAGSIFGAQPGQGTGAGAGGGGVGRIRLNAFDGGCTLDSVISGNLTASGCR